MPRQRKIRLSEVAANDALPARALDVEDAGGLTRTTDVVRVGVFNAINENGFLNTS